jgi:hypothetical protein
MQWTPLNDACVLHYRHASRCAAFAQKAGVP